MTVKRITFVRRADGVAEDDFGARWREWATERAADAPAGARPLRVVHCVVRPGRAERTHHGVAIEWFADDDALVAHDGHVADRCDEPVIDPATVVTASVEERTVFGEDLLETWWRDRAAGARLLLIAMIQRAPELSRDEFRDYWWGVHRPLANRMFPPDVQPPIYVHDYVRPGEDCPWDGIGELYETSIDVARARQRWAESEVAEPIRIDEARFLVRATRHALITDAEVVSGVSSD